MSIQARKMVATLVDWYAERNNGLLELDLKDIPESDINNLASTILAADDELASEATGPDNPEWYGSMLPALIRTMQNQKNGYNMEEFHDIWTSGIRVYLARRMERMINDRLEILNEDRVCHMSLTWDRARERAVELCI